MTTTEDAVIGAPPARPRVRLVRASLQLDVVLDDGETLTSLAVEPLVLSADGLAGLSVPALMADVERAALERLG